VNAEESIPSTQLLGDLSYTFGDPNVNMKHIVVGIPNMKKGKAFFFSSTFAITINQK